METQITVKNNYLFDAEKPDENWYSKYLDDLIEDITKFTPEEGCRVNPYAVVGKYPFEWNKELLRTKSLNELIALKTILQNGKEI